MVPTAPPTPYTSRMPRLSRRVSSLPPSATVRAHARAAELRAEGADIIDLTAGEPDRRGPTSADDGAIAAIRGGETRYGPAAGLPGLRDAIAARRPEGRTADEVLVTTGAKHALHTALQALVEPGDEVIVPTPCWVSFPALVQLAGGVFVGVPGRSERGFRVDPAAVEAAITPRTRVIVLNSPGNPTGAVCSEQDLRTLAALADAHDLTIVSDEIYAGLVFDGDRAPSPASILHERTLAIDGVSKAFAMTGWRVGWAVGPRDLIAAMARYQGQTAGGTSPPNQRAAEAALRDADRHRADLVALFRARRDATRSALLAVPGMRCHEPGGAIYLLPDVSAWLGRPGLATSTDLASYLLEEAQVATVAGDPFGAPNHLRLSLVAEQEVLDEAVARIGAALPTI